MLTAEHHFLCPYCAARISMVLDLSISPQQYIEDCEVCCQPIEVTFEVKNGHVINFSTQTTDQ
ncbi:CPXCG motif-containing cysteine-rich protein [Echinicola sediminis]